MEIRTITVGAREADLGRATEAAQHARTCLESAGYKVQSLRLALMQVSNTCADVVTVAQGVERLALDAGFDYVSIGQIEARRLPDLAEAISATETVFASASIADLDGVVRYDTIRTAAETIVAIGAATPQGFGNLRFAASAYVAPQSPFFPAAYHDGGAPWLAVGPEASALAVEATHPLLLKTEQDRHDERGSQKETLEAATMPHASIAVAVRQAALALLTSLIEKHDARINDALTDLYSTCDVRFIGCDWSLAPHPDAERSIGAAVEALSGVPFGTWGTLAAIRALTTAVRTAQVQQLGFSGVMLPVLEDATLAQRNNQGYYTLRDLLAFSAVCGTGLDTIPLAGDVMAEQIAGVLLEVAVLASTLRKPLTARLLPIPALRSGEITAFEFPYFVNTRVMRM